MRIFHNTRRNAPLRDGYRAATDTVIEVYAYDHTGPAADSDILDILDAALAVFGPCCPGRLDRRYQPQINRTIVLGDVVAVDDRYYAYQPGGFMAPPLSRFTAITRPTQTFARIPGSVPLFSPFVPGRIHVGVLDPRHVPCRNGEEPW